MKILQVRSVLSDMGPGTQPLSIAKELRRRGHEVSFATSGGVYAQEVIKAGFKVHIVPTMAHDRRDPLSTLRTLRAVGGIVASDEIDVIHGHNAAATFLAYWGARLRGCKVHAVNSVRGLEQRPDYLWRNYIYRILPGQILTVANITQRELVAIGVNPGRITVTNNGYDPLRFDRERTDPMRIRKEFGLEGKRIIGCVGAMVRRPPSKGQHILVQAFKQIADRFPDLHLVLVGDGEGRPDVESEVQSLSLQKRVTLTGRRFDTPDLFASFDVYSLPSIEGEIFPNSIVEAMALGVPWVGSDIAGLKELTANGEAGIVVPISNVEALAKALAMLLADEALRQKMGARALAEARERFTISSVVDRIFTAYLLGGGTES